MKLNFYLEPTAAARFSVSRHNARLYRAVILLVSATCGEVGFGQTTNAPPAASGSPDAGGSTNVVKLAPTTVVGNLDAARNHIVPDLGASTYTLGLDQVQAVPQGENAGFNQLLLRAPGMAQDSAANGDLHLRGEHANIQYRINDVLLPEGITGFGQELNTRFVDNLRLITGSLPAQYGFRTAGIVDIHTKSGAFEPGGEASTYGGSFDTINPGVQVGGSQGNLNFFANGSYDQHSLGIENPTSSATAIHDKTYQYKGFTYLSYVLDDTSRISIMGSGANSSFQVPNTPGLPASTSPGGIQWVPGNFDSTALNENQAEQSYYGVVAYQKSAGNLNLQLAAYGRSSEVHFTPDPLGDLYFNGVASDVNRTLYSGGMQLDTSYELGDSHTIRGGLMLLDESLSSHAINTVFATDAGGDPLPGAEPFNIYDNSVQHALFYGVYLQDEWKILSNLTLNFGARFDVYDSSFDHENQPSPRANLIYQPTKTTTLHAGYARYFTPPALENVAAAYVHRYDFTSNQSPYGPNAPANSARSERANYFDVGASQKLAEGLQVGIDGYYKKSQEQIDDGLFGQTLILSTFNYRQGTVYGVEFTGSYTTGGFSTYANVAWSQAKGLDINTSQFLFDQPTLAYSAANWIYLDHDQRVTGSFGAAYLWKRTNGSTRVYADALYGSGLRTDGTAPDGSAVPNGGTVASYFSVSLGVQEAFKIHGKDRVLIRLDAVNVTDNSYELRDGSGVGVNAAQYGMRFGLFGGVSYLF